MSEGSGAIESQQQSNSGVDGMNEPMDFLAREGAALNFVDPELALDTTSTTAKTAFLSWMGEQLFEYLVVSKKELKM